MSIWMAVYAWHAAQLNQQEQEYILWVVDMLILLQNGE